MKESVDKKLDKLSRRMVEDAKLDQPSFGFTTNILDQIKSLSNSSLFVYRPLISKRVWLLIGLAVISLVLFLLVDNSQNSNVVLQWDLKIVPDFQIQNPFEAIEIPKSLLYASFAFLAMCIIQFGLIKRFLDRKFRS